MKERRVHKGVPMFPSFAIRVAMVVFALCADGLGG